jgi:hypothetical protein
MHLPSTEETSTMRKTAISLLTLGLVAASFATATAGSLLTESFTYPDGGLVANSGGNWTTHSGAGTDIALTSGTILGSTANAPDDNRLFGPRTATDKTYACFRVRIPQTAAAITAANYFAHFMVNTTTFRSKVFIAPSGSSFTFGLTVTANASGTPALIPAANMWGTALNFDQWYTVAISYDAATGTSEMWVDPSSEASPKVTVTEAGTGGGALTAFGFRQSAVTGAAFTFNADDLSVGTTFSDACGGATGTQNSTWGRIKTIYR